MILIFVIIPFIWLWLLKIKLVFREKLLAGNGIFWLLITPIIWSLNKFANYLVTPKLFWVLVSLITLILIIYRTIKIGWRWEIRLPRFKFNWVLLTTLVFFILLHFIFYRFYITMPEQDGYTNILRIEKMMKTGVIDNQYRPLFYTGMTILGQVTKIDIYQIHTVWMIVLSVTYLIVISLLIEKNKIKNHWLKILILFSGLAVPVINMEIDFFRPQSLYLLIFPIIFYLEKKNKNYLALLISLIGMGYHQFFIFPIIILILKIFINLNKIKRVLVLIMIIFLGIFFYNKIVLYLPINRIFENIGQINKYRWWFLNSYQTYPDNVEMGWPGFSGAAKYYGYYFGPLILAYLGLIMFKIKKFTNQIYWFLLIGILLIISEVLPRLNVIYLPERFPLLINITVLLLIPSLFRHLKINKFLLAVLILIGILGSVYIAKSKGSLTNKYGLEAADWIRNNTPSEAIILTQNTNKPMIIYFSKRKFLNPGKIFFEGESFSGYFIDANQDNSTISKIDDCKNCYILYSSNKSNSLRSERGYWSEYNYEGIDLDKFNLLYKKVYEKDGINIWEIK